VALCRALTLGQVHWWAAAGDTLYLLALVIAGSAVARVTYGRRLVV
jgi:hypothetical protein